MTRDDGHASLIPADLLGPVLSLRQLWVMVWAYRVWIAAFVFGVVVATAVVSKLLPKSYRSTATLLVAFQVDHPISGREFSAMLAQSFMATQLELVRSRGALLAAVDRLGLVDNPVYLRGYTGDRSTESVRNWVAGQLNRRLSVDKGKDSRFIYVTAEDTDPVGAAALANAVAEGYVGEQLRQAVEPARERAGRYAEQLEGLKKKVDEAQARVTAFREKAGLIELSDAGDVEAPRLLDIDRRLSEARAKRQQAELRLRGAGEGDASVLGSNLIQGLKSQLTQKEAQMAELKGSLGSRHPQILSLQSEIDQTRGQLNREIAVYGDGARSEAQAARSLEVKLEQELEEQRKRSLSARAVQEDGARLVRELETATKVYQSALDSYDKVLMGSAMPSSAANIVSPAVPPTKKFKPQTIQNMLLAMIISLMLGVGTALLVEFSNRRLRCREDFERDLRMPVLAELPAGGR